MRKSDTLIVSGIASREPGRARAVATELGIERTYGSYEAILADSEIEAIYNPLPNHLHVPMTLAAVRAGKHVLCEKPMALECAELELLRPYARRVHIREAFMVRYHPQWIEARELVRRDVIGETRFAQVGISYFNNDPTDIRNRADMGGGALYDIGCYAVAAGRWFFDANPLRAVATMDFDPLHETDRCTSGLLEFPGGRQLAFSASTQAARYQRVTIAGTRGRIEIEIPVNAPQDAPCRIRIDDGTSLNGSSSRFWHCPAADQYQLQAEAFSRAVREEQPNETGLEDAIWNMRTIDALLSSARSGRFESV